MDSQLDPVECTDEGCGGKEVSGEFVVARGDPPPVFDTAKVVFDFVSSSVKALGTIGFLGGIAAAGDDWQSTLILDLLAHILAVVSLVGGDGQWRPGSVEYVANDLTVVDLPARHREVPGAAFAVDNGVDFRGATACRSDTGCRAISMPACRKSASRCRAETSD